jgi:hypothetical protein
MNSPPSTKYLLQLLALLAVSNFPPSESATASDTKKRPTIATTAAKGDYSGEQIPVGFKLERYAGMWEHNPFFFVKPAVPQVQRSPFDKLFLTSWLNDAGKDIIFVQDSETNEVQKITTEANQNKLRLIGLRSNPNPRLVEAQISNGKEQGVLKFQFESPVGHSAPPAAQQANTPASGRRHR